MDARMVGGKITTQTYMYTHIHTPKNLLGICQKPEIWYESKRAYIALGSGVITA